MGTFLMVIIQFCKVISGMDVVDKIKKGDPATFGMIEKIQIT